MTPTYSEITDYIDETAFYGENHLVRRMHDTLPLSIITYTPDCQFGKSWNPITLNCRGIIFDVVTGELVARSFPKFFNMNEPCGLTFDELPKSEPYIQEKIDGSLGIVTKYKGEWLISTKGSFHSDQANYAREYLLPKFTDKLDKIGKDLTFLCEIIYPENRIVVNYGGKNTLVIYAVYDGTQELPYNEVLEIAEFIGMETPKLYTREEVGENYDKFFDNEEGYVLRWDFPNKETVRIKVKSPSYVLAHRLFSGVSFARVLDIKREVELVDIPEMVKDVYDDMLAALNTKAEWVRKMVILYIERLNNEDFKTRKESAIWIQNSVPRDLHVFCYSYLDGKDPETLKSKDGYNLIEKLAVQELKANGEN